MENWKDIVDFPNYEVSDLGNVRNKRNKFVLKPRPFKKSGSYICYEVNISKDGGKQLHKKIHRLVAEAFIPKIEGKDEVDHIDRNTANNAITNLRWVNRSENCQNTGTRSDNTSGEKNIFYNIQKQKWQFRYMENSKNIHCGFYDTFEAAKAAKESGKYTISTTTTGEKHITFRENRYKFEKTHNGIRQRKSFATLEEAIIYRDNILSTLLE